MNILVLNYEYPPLGGGAGVVTQNISEGIAKKGHNVTVITTWYEGLKTQEQKENLLIIRLKSKRKFLYRSNVFEMLSWIKHSEAFLLKYCKDNSFDFCLANFSIPGGWVALSLYKAFRLPYAVISHGHDIPWFFPREMWFYHLFSYVFIKKICLLSTLNIMLTPNMKKNIDKFLGIKYSHKNIVIPNGCNTEFFTHDFSKKVSDFTLLFTGRLVPQKNPLVFLKALKILYKKGIPFQAKIIGDGVLRKKMEIFVRKNFPVNKVIFLGWKTRNEIIKEYQSAHVYVQTSRYEAMSVSPIEAICCGTYVICTPAGANQDIVGKETGEIFYPNRPYILAEKLINFYYQHFQQKKFITIENIEKIKKLYSIDATVEKYLQAIENTLASL